MNKIKQASIGLTSTEKDRLAGSKKLYEEKTGDKGDWGSFLRVVTDLAMGALGIVNVQYLSWEKSAVECPSCGTTIMAPRFKDWPRVMDMICPQCGAFYIVAFFER